MKKLISTILAAAIAFAALPAVAGGYEGNYGYHRPKVIVKKIYIKGDTVTKTEYVESNGGGDGGAGLGMFLLTGWFFLGAICQKEAGLPAAEKSALFTELCKQGELPDPFESYAQ